MEDKERDWKLVFTRHAQPICDALAIKHRCMDDRYLLDDVLRFREICRGTARAFGRVRWNKLCVSVDDQRMCNLLHAWLAGALWGMERQQPNVEELHVISSLSHLPLTFGKINPSVSRLCLCLRSVTNPSLHLLFRISDLWQISHNLRELTLTHSDSELAGLEICTALEKLHLEYVSASTIPCLPKLTHLTCSSSSLQSIASMPKLRELYLNKCHELALNLRDFPGVKVLDVCVHSLPDVTSATRVHTLTLCDYSDHIPGLSTLKNLQSLSFVAGDVDTRSLASLSGLTRLDLTLCHLPTNLDLRANKSLQELDIYDVEGLRGEVYVAAGIKKLAMHDMSVTLHFC